MKDKQVYKESQDARVFLLSPCLHVLAMPVLVFLRRNFGYAYLRPKSIFIALIYAHALYCYYAWHEPRVWENRFVLCAFGVLAALLYLAHLGYAVATQLAVRAKHDYYSGTSWLLTITEPFLKISKQKAELHIHLWAEPAAVFIAGRLLAPAPPAGYFTLAALCLLLKESINYWHRLRKSKRHGDVLSDAEEQIERAAEPTLTRPIAGTATSRTPRKKRARAAASGRESGVEERYAEILELSPPYRLEQAKENYRRLIKLTHPDVADDQDAAHELAARLNEALGWFTANLPANG